MTEYDIATLHCEGISVNDDDNDYDNHSSENGMQSYDVLI